MDFRVRMLEPAARHMCLVNTSGSIRWGSSSCVHRLSVHRRLLHSLDHGRKGFEHYAYGIEIKPHANRTEGPLRQSRAAPIGTAGISAKQQSQPGGERLRNDAHTAPRPRPVAGKVSSFFATPAGGNPQSGTGPPRMSSPVPRPSEGSSFGVTSQTTPGVAPSTGPPAKDAERPVAGRLYSQGPGKAPEPAPLATRQGAAAAPGSPPAPQALRPLVDMHFWLGYHTEFGQSIRIIGSDTAFGDWQLERGVQMQWNEGDQWKATVKMQAGQVYQYKYAVVNSQGHAVAWQNGNNNVLAVKVDDADVNVYDSWDASPGAKVIAGGLVSTRENRLLNWAKEIEALVHEQRSQLRLSKIELQAAQDEARKEREFGLQAKAELAKAEAELRKSNNRVAELETVNRLLRTQLKETQATFRHALETAQQYIVEAQDGRMFSLEGGLESFVNGKPPVYVESDSHKVPAGTVPLHSNGKP